MQKFIHRNRKGFSLIELIVVMAVMAILVLLAAPRFLGYTKDAAVSAMQADAKVLSNAALQYNIKTEAWPVDTSPAITTLAGLDAVVDAEGFNALTDALVDQGILTFTAVAADNDDAVEALDIRVIDPASSDDIDFSTLVKNTKNDIDAYYLITAGPFAGEVFYEKSLEDSSNTWHNGVYELLAAPDAIETY